MCKSFLFIALLPSRHAQAAESCFQRGFDLLQGQCEDDSIRCCCRINCQTAVGDRLADVLMRQVRALNATLLHIGAIFAHSRLLCSTPVCQFRCRVNSCDCAGGECQCRESVEAGACHGGRMGLPVISCLIRRLLFPADARRNSVGGLFAQEGAFARCLLFAVCIAVDICDDVLALCVGDATHMLRDGTRTPCPSGSLLCKLLSKAKH